MAPLPSTDTLPLRRLLVLGRDLLQTHGLKAVLELVGPALRDLSAPDDSLLLVTLAQGEYMIAFTPRGSLQPADQEGVLYRHARQALADEVPLVLPALSVDRETSPGGRPAGRTASLLAIPFPPVRPVGALAVLWYREEAPEVLAGQASILWQLSELTGAALGNVDFQLALEERISATNAEVQAATEEHAKELRRRDDIDREKDRIAVTDVMTGMLNRRGFFLHAEQAFNVVGRQGKEGAVIFADIDGLKAVNDQLGHDAGDQLLQSGAQILRKSFRDSDVVARLGGDEFAALVLGSEQPETILARIRENTDLFNQESSAPYKVAFSIGIVACDPSSELTLADYLSLADKKMYEDKKEHH